MSIESDEDFVPFADTPGAAAQLEHDASQKSGESTRGG